MIQSEQQTYKRLVQVALSHQRQGEESLEDMFEHMVNVGNFNLARKYLEEVKTTFSKYETYKDILGEDLE